MESKARTSRSRTAKKPAQKGRARSSKPADKKEISFGKYAEFAKNFNAALDAAGYPGLHYGRQVVVGKDFGISTSAARKWVSGECLPDNENLLKIADKLKVGLDTLFGRSPRIAGEPMISIPLGVAPTAKQASAQAATQSGHWLNQFTSIQMEASWLETGMKLKRDNLFLMTVAGDNMSPTLSDGDVVFVESASVPIDEIEENSIYLIMAQGKPQLRRILLGLDDKVMLTSDNKHFPSISVPVSAFRGHKGAKPAIEIIGRVPWCIHRVSRASAAMPLETIR